MFGRGTINKVTLSQHTLQSHFTFLVYACFASYLNCNYLSTTRAIESCRSWDSFRVLPWVGREHRMPANGHAKHRLIIAVANRFDLTCIGLGPNLPKTFPSSILITCLSSLWGHSSAPPTVDAAATADPMASHGPEASHAMGSAMSSGGDRGWASHGRVNGKTYSGRYFSGIWFVCWFFNICQCW